MQYGVPQFINIEDKVVGPLTARQTLYLMIGGAILIISFTVFEFVYFAFIFAIVAPIVLAFAFWKPRGITVARWILNIINYFTTPHVYVWRKEPDIKLFKAKIQKKKIAVSQKETIGVKRVPKSRIRELAWMLDTSTSVSLHYEARERPDESVFRR